MLRVQIKFDNLKILPNYIFYDVRLKNSFSGCIIFVVLFTEWQGLDIFMFVKFIPSYQFI